VKNPELVISWFEKYGADKIILGADAKNEQIAVSGWQENSNLSVYDFVSDYVQKGAKYIISTDVAKDGLLQGPSFDLYKNLQKQNSGLNIIASGGVSNLEDLQQLKAMNLFGVIVGKAFYEGKITLEQLAQFA